MVNFSLRPLAVALLGAGVMAGAAHGQTGPEFKFSGFGTVSAVYSDNRQADFLGAIFQPNGAGYTRQWSFDPDSKFGAQFDAVFNNRFSAVVQLVAQDHYDNSYMPQVEWANVKWQATPELSVRLGRIAAPSFLVSDTRFVGYSHPWVRPPVEVYGVLPITSNDGIDATYRRAFGSVNNTLQAYYGNSSASLKTGKAKSNPGWGINNTMQMGDVTLRAGYVANKVDLNFPTIQTLLNGINSLSAIPGPIGAQATALRQKYSMDDMKLGAFSVSASYDPGTWMVMGEFVDSHGAGILADSRSFYVTGAYRMGAFTPYATFARVRSDVAFEPGIAFAPAAALNAGLNTTLNNQFNGSQSTSSVGVRWDFMKNMALKAQYDHVDLDERSAGRFGNAQPTFERGGKVNLFSLALDFVF